MGLSIVVATFLVISAAASQFDPRPFRAANHIVMAARLLQPTEQWNGIAYTENGTKYAVTSWGSSCAVSKSGYLLTNNHVVPADQIILVGGWSDGSKLVHGSVEKRDEKDDLALIKVEPPNEIAYLTRFTSSAGLLEGQDIFVWGYLQIPGGFVQFLRRGIVSMNTPIEGFQHYLYIETSASFGTSGSPVFTQPDGQVIGLVSLAITLPSGLPLPAGILGVIPGERVSEFLKAGGVPGY
jgi:S1-C subfamily serine protease